MVLIALAIALMGCIPAFIPRKKTIVVRHEYVDKRVDAKKSK